MRRAGVEFFSEKKEDGTVQYEFEEVVKEIIGEEHVYLRSAVVDVVRKMMHCNLVSVY